MPAHRCWRAAALALGLALGSAAAATAQDSVIVIDPDAPLSEDGGRSALPPALLQRLVDAYNDSAATRLAGAVFLPAGTVLEGRVVLFRGSLRIAGRVVGPVTVINGDLFILPGGRIEGPVTVVGGRFTVAPGADHEGEAVVRWDLAPLARDADGRLVVRERRRPLAGLGAAEARFTVGRIHTTLRASTGGNYNRVEGLPLQAGPLFELRPGPRSSLRLSLQGILRTSDDRSGLRGDVGYQAQLDWRSYGRPGWGLGLQAYSTMAPIPDDALSLNESGWSAFLLQRDYRDWYERDGVTAFAYAFPARQLRLGAALEYDDVRSVRDNDPWSLLRNSDRWRSNPLVDDGRYLIGSVDLTLDTRNTRDFTTSGWWVRGRWERGASDDVAPLMLPASVRDPIPTDGSYRYDRLAFDLRRYSRLLPGSQFNARLVGGGWLGGDPLPIQRRLSLGGPDLLPGYGFRALTCGGATVNPSAAGLCDRYLALQLEFRTRLSLGWTYHVRDRGETNRMIGIDEADLVIFADAGDAWLSGPGPGRVPHDRIPAFKEWKADLGAGVDLGGLGVYLAKALTDGEPVRLVVRLQRRF